ncbi:MAG: hypothetical protein ACRD98_09885 [Nitrososphaera sp.]
MKLLSRCLLFASVLLSGCGGLLEMWEGPAAESFRPRSIAVLPPIIGDYEAAREPAQEVLMTSLKKTNRYERVFSRDEVNATFQTSKEALSALVAYYTQLETTGQSDKEAAVKLGQLLQTEALLVVKVNAWEYTRSEGDNLAKVGFSLRLVEVKHGSIIWKARHQYAKSYIFFKPNLGNLAQDLSDYMITHVP